MIEYIEEVLQKLRATLENETTLEDDKAQSRAVIESMQTNLDKLKPVIDAHNKDYSDLQAREAEMERLIHEFRNSLMIEKIKMDTWENKKK